MTEYKERMDAKKKKKQLIILGIVILIGIIGFFVLHYLFQDRLEALRADQAKSTIEDIYVASVKYKKENGKWPSSLNELEDMGYWLVSKSANYNWDFYLVGKRAIRAISRYKMAGGAGKTVDYVIAEDKFIGYGSPEEGEIVNFKELEN
ncbi:MAG: hypothetical protein P9L92_11245 [Candidatus Electryonea clarkiae]|nr:hypothetical protein [Candidatus Electryonea clarkiae]MDP8287009.1 hypothetical protein [Candidatus Electryonea clarkiae]